MSDERKLDAVEQLIPLAREAGVSLTHLAMAFVIAHPGVTSAIIGPRTMQHLDDLLAGAEVRLDDEMLDRIDADRPARHRRRPERGRTTIRRRSCKPICAAAPPPNAAGRHKSRTINSKEITMQDRPVALVTGANQGIGLQIAKDLAAHGFTVLVGSRNHERARAAAKSIGAEAHALQLDVTDQAWLMGRER